jgi:hypothetical protein
MTLSQIWHQIIGMAEACGSLATQHDHGTAFLPRKISSAALRDLAYAGEHNVKMLSPSTLITIARNL